MSGLNCTIFSHEASQSGHGGGRGTGIRASSMNPGGGDETGLYDGSVVIDGRSRKTHASERVKSSPPKIVLIPGLPGSHEISNSCVIKAILLKTLKEQVHQACNFLTVPKEEPPKVNRHLIINCKFMQDAIWICHKFVIIIANYNLSRNLIM